MNFSSLSPPPHNIYNKGTAKRCACFLLIDKGTVLLSGSLLSDWNLTFHFTTFLQSALDDLEEIVLYISKDSKERAMEMHDKIIQLATKLETFPKLGIQVPDKNISARGFRMIAIDRYLLFYKVYPEEICVLRVLHGGNSLLFTRFTGEESK